MRTTLSKLNERSTFVTSPPARLLTHLQDGIQFPVFRTVLPYRVRTSFTSKADPRSALPTNGFKRMLRVNLIARRNEVTALWIGTEDSLLPGCAELQHCLEETCLLLAWQNRSYDWAWYRLRATSWGHLRFVGRGLVNHDPQAPGAIAVTTW